MYFNSYIFIFLFVPVTVILYLFLNRKEKYRISQVVLLVMSLFFYSFGNIYLLGLISVSILFNYLCSFFMEKKGHRGFYAFIAVVFDLGLLFYFKYFDFFVSNINAVAKTNWPLKHIILPMGISFYTFQQIAYIIDRKRSEAPHYDLLDYASFVTFFPQLVAGPIVSHDVLVPQFKDKKKKVFNWTSFTKGLFIFMTGLCKKVLIADILSLGVDHAYSDIAALDTPAAVCAMLLFTFQLYFDFSGYSDMAIGLGMMMNIDLPINFDSPYRSRSIREFWQRWHITLNAFFVKYVYIPLGGSRKGSIIRERNVLIVFLLSGIWHGADWTFILWGVLNGIIIVFEDIFKTLLDKIDKNKAGRMIRHVCCFILINMLWVIFRCDKVRDVPLFFSRLFSMEFNGGIMELAKSMNNSLLYVPRTVLSKIDHEWYYVADVINISVMLIISMVISIRKEAAVFIREGRAGAKYAYMLVLFSALAVVSLSKVVVFLYSNF